MVNEFEELRELVHEDHERSQWELDKLSRELKEQVASALEGIKVDLKQCVQREFCASKHKSIDESSGSGDDGGVMQDQKRKACLKIRFVEFALSFLRYLDMLVRTGMMCMLFIDGCLSWRNMLNFFLGLNGRNLYSLSEILPSHVKGFYAETTDALQERLNPVDREALVSAQLMQHRQRATESVDEFAQELKKLYERSYGRRQGMDEGSKEMLKRDIFVQGLCLKWQDNVQRCPSSGPCG